MEQLHFITKLLDIKDTNIQIIDVVNRDSHKEIIAKLDYDAPSCPECGNQLKKYDFQKPSKIPYLETTGMPSRILLRKRRFKCYHCSKMMVQSKNYSGKKKRHTLKTQIMLDLTTHKVCQMAFSDGHTHDFTLFKESIGQSLPETTLAFVDLGYLGILKFHENTFIPAKNSKNRRLSEDDKQLNKEMSAIRIEIEHFNAKFKTFQIMSVPYRNRRKRFELRAELICAIINYEVN
ncbi:transposase [Streptococcus pneumoniae]|nr:transposase [Streptococcus pneumoniae]COM68291.1 transposase-like protein%2C IS1515 [Streptococcus pneumoniae]